HEEVLPREEVTERLRRDGDERDLRISGIDVEPDGMADERDPSAEEDRQEDPLADHAHDAGARDDGPRLPRHRLAAAVAAVALVMYRHRVLFLSQCLREHVL